MRIISGSARGRQLKSPKGMLTRPTLDSTRESIFNILANNYGLAGSRVLDIFTVRTAGAARKTSRSIITRGISSGKMPLCVVLKDTMMYIAWKLDGLWQP